MKLNLPIILFLYSLEALCQDSIPNNNSENTPFGVSSKSNIHYISNNQIVFNDEEGILIKELNSNSTIKRVQYSKSLTKNIFLTNGWSTYAVGQSFDAYPSNPTFFEVTFVVPSAPKNNNQLIYIFNGLGTIVTGIAHIVQPVLQWGASPAGGGNYWAICNWYVNNNQFFHDSLMRVNPGDTLRGLIELTSISNGNYNYRSSFIGFNTGLQVNNLPELKSLYITLETYYADCNDLPIDEKIRFSDIRVKTQLDHPNILWHSLNNNTCGQYTTIVDKNSLGGEIHINFHSPLSIDDYDEIHIYPNPVTDFLHISPNGIKSVIGYRKEIKYCTIQIFNSNGGLVLSELYPNLNFEFNLDLGYLNPGTYLIRFSYEDKSHSFKIIKI